MTCSKRSGELRGSGCHEVPSSDAEGPAVKVPRSLRVGSEISPASLADIAFLLLIFFLTATSLESDHVVPLSVRGVGVPVLRNPEEVSVLRSDRDGNWILDGMLVSRAEAARRIQRTRERTPGLVLSLRPDAEAPFQELIDLLEVSRAASIERVAIEIEES